ncbi:MAG TPA: carbamoyltransferase HypF [Candidatus Omnitrophota bacterium]|nr:carbamoyltransferase HypF [Candidatus Omnitrophota bacterium]
MIKAARIQIAGMVQGVGFRPFVHRLSQRFGLTGSVRNTSAGVEITAEGSPSALTAFYSGLRNELPPLARIFRSSMRTIPARGRRGFRILESIRTQTPATLISPDIGICPACLKEIFDPRNRRYLYPFTNCTDCGPRFSIIAALPYDRSRTTMRAFRMCPACRREYGDIKNRRYHAQPNACGDCGPQVELLVRRAAGTRTIARGNNAVSRTIKLLKQGRLVAIKGVGGFHIGCNAFDRSAVTTLRRNKHRPAKPFALMVADIRQAEKLCRISPLERRILTGPERPIVLLNKRSPDDKLCALLAPDNNYLGIMLAYAPLHYLLFAPELSAQRPLECLVMTSANIADEPIEIDNQQACRRLGKICDTFLVHDRPIYNRSDDSIVQVMDDKPVILRRGRGYSPFPFVLDYPSREIFACGAELKNTFCLAKNRLAFLSQYIGDLSSLETLRFYTESFKRLSGLFSIRPKLVAHDMHPDYLSTRFALQLRQKHPALKTVAIQHHQAHVASVIAEHRIGAAVIGVCFDGTGYGTDGRIWGGEFFCGTLKKMERTAHLEYVAMPGGDQAAREPFRMAISYLHRCFGENSRTLDIPFAKKFRHLFEPILAAGRMHPILTSSAGRLFDAVSALIGACETISYEAQAAVRLQRLAERSSTAKAYPFAVFPAEDAIISALPAFREMVEDIRCGIKPAVIAAGFHNGLARAVLETCKRLRTAARCRRVCLSGGVFQNRLFLEKVIFLLKKNDFLVYYNELVPTNDGAIALGQAVLAKNSIAR